MANYCEDCGTKKYSSGFCPNCQEESCIYHDQYMSPNYLGNGEMLTPPDDDSVFMQKVREQSKQ